MEHQILPDTVVGTGINLKNVSCPSFEELLVYGRDRHKPINTICCDKCY